MIQSSKRGFRFLLIGVLIFSVSLPIYKKETSDFALMEKGLEALTEKISSDAWSLFSESANALKKKLFEEDKPTPLTAQQRFFETIRSGWHYGISSVGAAEKVLHDTKFNIHHLSSILVSLLIFTVFIELLLLLFIKWIGKYLGFISFISILLCLAIYGEVNNDKEYAITFGGLILFSLVQLLLLVLSSLTQTNSIR